MSSQGGGETLPSGLLCAKMVCWFFFSDWGVRGGDTEIWQSTYHISEMEDMIGSLVIVAGAWRVTKITTFHQDSARQCTCRPVTCDFPLALNLNFGGTGVTRCVQYEGKLPVFSGLKITGIIFNSRVAAGNQLASRHSSRLKEPKRVMFLHVLSEGEINWWIDDHVVAYLALTMAIKFYTILT